MRVCCEGAQQGFRPLPLPSRRRSWLGLRLTNVAICQSTREWLVRKETERRRTLGAWRKRDANSLGTRDASSTPGRFVSSGEGVVWEQSTKSRQARRTGLHYVGGAVGGGRGHSSSASNAVARDAPTNTARPPYRRTTGAWESSSALFKAHESPRNLRTREDPRIEGIDPFLPHEGSARSQGTFLRFP